MGFNYGYERKKFEAEWKKLRKEYALAGMSEDAIDELYRFDLDSFNAERAYRKHTQPMKGFTETEERSVAGDVLSPMQKHFLKSLSIEARITDPDRRFAWIDELDDEEIVKALKTLPESDIDLLTLYAIEEYTVTEISRMQGIAQPTVTKKITRLKRFLKNFSSEAMDQAFPKPTY